LKFANKTSASFSIILIMVTIMLFASLTADTPSADLVQPVTVPCGELTITVDPRIELLCVIQWRAGSDMATRDATGYADAIDAWFAPYKQHPAIEHNKRLEEKRFSYDAPVSYFLQNAGVPLENKCYDFVPDMKKMAMKRYKSIAGRREFSRFTAEVNDFVRQSRFGEFYAQQTPLYRVQVDCADSLLADARIVETIIDWYGYRQSSYSLVLSPLQGGGGYGPSMVNAAGNVDVMCITALDRYDDPKAFVSTMAIMMYHEFSHSYVNPLVEQYYPRLKKTEGLYVDVLRQQMYSCYTEWKTLLFEHYVRASVLRLLAASPQLYQSVDTIDNQHGQGFLYTRFICEGLEQYEQQRRQTGVTYRDYFPTLVDGLLELARDPRAYLAPFMRFSGPVNGAVLHAKYVIYPDPDENPGVNEYILPTVEFIHNRLGVELVTDTQAMNMNLADCSFLVYGPPQNNKWLAAHLDMLPFHIYPDSIVADSTYTGTNLRIVSCLPNPQNPQLGVAIYTAQTMPAMKGSNNMNHGQEDYVISDAECNVLGRGDYDKSGERWRFMAQ